MTEHKTDMNIIKYKKLNMIEHKTDTNITKIDKYEKIQQQFYDGVPNTWALLNTKNWAWRNTKRTWQIQKT